jgi:hypothetical protein
MNGWGSQGEILPNVIQPGSPVDTQLFDKKVQALDLQHGQQYVILVDKKKEMSRRDLLSAFTMVDPAMVQKTLRSHNSLFIVNNKIMDLLSVLSQSEWRVEKQEISKNLNAIILSPVGVP